MSRRPFAFPPKKRAAFTLVELLTVIAIIGVLAGILIPVGSKARASAHLAECTSNLRQVGVAINLYATDNRGTFPGALYTGQGPRFRSTDVGSLAQTLDRYLPSSTPTNVVGAKMQECLKCPAWEGQTRDVTSTSYQLNVAPTGWGVSPFGRIQNDITINPPMKLNQINSFDLARTWMMIDADEEWANQVTPRPSWSTRVPEKPVHGGIRNVLYYDLRVAQAPLTMTR